MPVNEAHWYLMNVRVDLDAKMWKLVLKAEFSTVDAMFDGAKFGKQITRLNLDVLRVLEKQSEMGEWEWEQLGAVLLDATRNEWNPEHTDEQCNKHAKKLDVNGSCGTCQTRFRRDVMVEAKMKRLLKYSYEQGGLQSFWRTLRARRCEVRNG